MRIPELNFDGAELFVVDQSLPLRVFAAKRALGVLAKLQLPELHLEAVECEQPAVERITHAEDQLDAELAKFMDGVLGLNASPGRTKLSSSVGRRSR